MHLAVPTDLEPMEAKLVEALPREPGWQFEPKWDGFRCLVFRDGSEVELKAKGTELHAATVVGDTVGDPFKDTSSVAMNPVIKFTTLFGLLAVELAVNLEGEGGSALGLALTGLFFALSLVFVWRSFYGMRIEGAKG